MSKESLYLIGGDEVGLGPIAGPLVVCAVLVRKDWIPPKGCKDSKQLSSKRISEISALLGVDAGVRFRVIARLASQIDELGIRKAHIAALQDAVKSMQVLSPSADAIVDGNLPLHFARSVVKADATVPAVSAASIIAKDYRDRIMDIYDQHFPGYGFSDNKGYPTPAHLEALARKGPCSAHRKTFAPVAELLKGKK